MLYEMEGGSLMSRDGRDALHKQRCRLWFWWMCVTRIRDQFRCKNVSSVSVRIRRAVDDSEGRTVSGKRRVFKTFFFTLQNVPLFFFVTDVTSSRRTSIRWRRAPANSLTKVKWIPRHTLYQLSASRRNFFRQRGEKKAWQNTVSHRIASYLISEPVDEKRFNKNQKQTAG